MPGFAARIVEAFESRSGTLARRAVIVSLLVMSACGDLSLECLSLNCCSVIGIVMVDGCFGYVFNLRFPSSP